VCVTGADTNTEHQMTTGRFVGAGELRVPSVVNVVMNANTVMIGAVPTIQQEEKKCECWYMQIELLKEQYLKMKMLLKK